MILSNKAGAPGEPNEALLARMKETCKWKTNIPHLVIRDEFTRQAILALFKAFLSPDRQIS
jgi:hypothetical protein